MRPLANLQRRPGTNPRLPSPQGVGAVAVLPGEAAVEEGVTEADQEMATGAVVMTHRVETMR